MPIYNYICDCGKKREEIKLISKIDNDVYCECGNKMERQFGTSQFVIHGHSYNNTYKKPEKPIIDVEL